MGTSAARDNDMVEAASRGKWKNGSLEGALIRGVCWQNTKHYAWSFLNKLAFIFSRMKLKVDLQYFGSFSQGGDWENVVR